MKSFKQNFIDKVIVVSQMTGLKLIYLNNNSNI